MDEQPNFAELLARVRSGDDQAARQLFDLYEPQVRRVVRVRLTSPSLRRQMDSMDVCQSIVGEFFVRVATGQFELQTPADLIHLLARMARNKVIDHTRRQRADRRDIRRLETVANDASFAGNDPTPSRAASAKELLVQVLRGLSEKDRYLAEQRGLGRN